MTEEQKKILPISEFNEDNPMSSLIDEGKMFYMIEQYKLLKPISFMSRVDTPKGEGFVVGYRDLFHHYILDGCIFLKNFMFPCYYVLLDATATPVGELFGYRLHEINKKDVVFIKSFADWLAERGRNAEEYFESLKVSRKVAQQKVKNVYTTKINEGEISAEKLQEYKHANVQETKELVKTPMLPPIVETIKEAVEIQTKIEEVISQPSKPKPKLRD